jgi:hypothetical protein
MTDTEKAAFKAMIERVKEQLKEAKSTEDAARIMARAIPEDVKNALREAGGDPSEDAFVTAAMFSAVAVEKIRNDLFLLLLSKPDHQHALAMKFPSLKDLMEDAKKEGFLGPAADLKNAMKAASA